LSAQHTPGFTRDYPKAGKTGPVPGRGLDNMPRAT
jgi:hypothetical protein